MFCPGFLSGRPRLPCGEVKQRLQCPNELGRFQVSLPRCKSCIELHRAAMFCQTFPTASYCHIASHCHTHCKLLHPSVKYRSRIEAAHLTQKHEILKKSERHLRLVTAGVRVRCLLAAHHRHLLSHPGLAQAVTASTKQPHYASTI